MARGHGRLFPETMPGLFCNHYSFAFAFVFPPHNFQAGKQNSTISNKIHNVIKHGLGASMRLQAIYNIYKLIKWFKTLNSRSLWNVHGHFEAIWSVCNLKVQRLRKPVSWLWKSCDRAGSPHTELKRWIRARLDRRHTLTRAVNELVGHLRVKHGVDEVPAHARGDDAHHGLDQHVIRQVSVPRPRAPRMKTERSPTTVGC